MRASLLFAGLALATSLLVSACGSSGSSSGTGKLAPAVVARVVTISSNSYHPASLIVPAGTHVVWNNLDSASHTVSSDAGSTLTFDSNALSKGKTFSVVFNHPGRYHYHDRLHPFMHGTIKVGSTRQIRGVISPRHGVCFATRHLDGVG